MYQLHSCALWDKEIVYYCSVVSPARQNWKCFAPLARNCTRTILCGFSGKVNWNDGKYTVASTHICPTTVLAAEVSCNYSFFREANPQIVV